MIEKILLGVAPWLVFTTLVSRGPSGEGAIASLAAAGVAIGATVARVRRDHITVIEITGLVTFTGLAIAGIAGALRSPLITQYGPGMSAAVLSMVMAVSAVTVPFTEIYSRVSTPRAYWTSPVFRAVNRRLSACWAAALTVTGGGYLLTDVAVAPASEVRARVALVEVALNWALPVLLVVLAGHAMTPSPRPPAEPFTDAAPVE